MDQENKPPIQEVIKIAQVVYSGPIIDVKTGEYKDPLEQFKKLYKEIIGMS